MAAGKGQEMVQTDRSGSSASLWRTISAPQSSRQTNDTSKVIGASYSHADMLKFDSLNISGSTRSRLSPLEPTRSSSRGSSPSSVTTSPQKQDRYARFVPGSSSEFHLDQDDDDDHEDMSAFDDGEDEFGLPSMRRIGRRRPSKKVNDPGGTGPGRPLPLSFTARTHSSPVVLTADNGDLAEERGLPTYPTASKSEGKILRPQYQEILRDPANSLHLISHPPVPANSTAKERDAHDARIGRINKFKRILQTSSVSLSELRDLAWSGIPTEVRAISWQILLSYLPTNGERRVSTLARKRKEYQDGVVQAFGLDAKGYTASGVMSPIMGSRPASARVPGTGTARGLDETIWHQISIDVPRTNPHLELYSYEATQRSLERILYVWAIRHPASGYVQGINDLVTPFWQVFLGSYITDPDIESGLDPGGLPKAVLDAVEADTFWCLTKLLDGIQDNYIFAQPGIQRQVGALRDLTTRIDEKLAKHLDSQGVEFIQFSFRWMNCLLMREISVKSTIRMWDTYLAEDQGFSQFHLYVCAAFLVKWSDKLMHMDFQEIMMFLQSLPTKAWDEKDIELLLSEAFIWQSLFRGSKAHIQQTNSEITPLNL